MKKKIILISSAVIIIVIAAFIFIKSKDTPAYNFRTAEIKKGNIDLTVTATGQLSAVTTVDVGTQVSGTIVKLNADFNSKVHKGEIIAVLDTTTLYANVEDAEANLNHINAQIIAAKSNFETEQALYNKKLDSQTNYDLALSNYKSLLAQKQQAEADLQKAKINLRYATIKAPINGIVISRNVDVGQTVAASLAAPTLFSIANDLKSMQVQADVDEADIGKVKVGQDVSFTVDAYPNKTFDGVVSQVRLAPQEIQNVVNYTVIINVNNDKLLLMPGMTATVSINISHQDSVLEVPDIAFYFQPAQNMIDQTFLQKRKESSFRFKHSSQETNKYAANIHSAFSKFGQSSFQQNLKTIWLLDGNNKIYPIRVRTGLDDGTYTQIDSRRIKSGDQVVLGTLSTNVPQTKNVNPFQPQNRFRRRNRGR
jgi:HlyD family secretion protein